MIPNPHQIFKQHLIVKKPAPGASPGDGRWAKDVYGTVFLCAHCREEGPWTLFTIASCPVGSDPHDPIITGIGSDNG
jgi:hypothetical protein